MLDTELPYERGANATRRRRESCDCHRPRDLARKGV